MSSLSAPVSLPRRDLRLRGLSTRGRCSRRTMTSRPRHHHTRRLCACGAARIRKQGDVARALDRHAQPALVAGTHSRHPPGQNLAPLLHELGQYVRALVVDEIHLLDAKLADLLFAEILPLPARAPSGAAGTTATRTASFAARATVPAASSAVTTMTAFTPRRSAGRWCLFLFFCHTFLPFPCGPELVRGEFSWDSGRGGIDS